MIKNIFTTSLIALAILLVAIIALDRQSKADCYKYQQYEKQYKDFELSPDMQDFCNSIAKRKTKIYV
jgi:hypothetical protein